MPAFRTSAASIFLLSLVSMLPNAHAAEQVRTEQLMAAGACEPFVPTTQVRYNASGLHNAGSSLIYVVCSMGGSPLPLNQNSRLQLTASNTSTVAQPVACTARPGVTHADGGSQLTAPLSSTLPADSAFDFVWTLSSFDNNAGVPSNPNFTCALGPGMSINYMHAKYTENVGL